MSVFKSESNIIRDSLDLKGVTTQSKTISSNVLDFGSIGANSNNTESQSTSSLDFSDLVGTNNGNQNNNQTDINSNLSMSEDVRKAINTKTSMNNAAVANTNAKEGKGLRYFLGEILDFTESALATGAVVVTSATSAVMKITEDIGDGLAYAVAGAADLLGFDDFAQSTRENIAVDETEEFMRNIYENTELGKKINEASFLKYDSDIAKGITKGSEFAIKIAAAAAIEILSGGTATPLLFAIGMAEGMGKASESAYQNVMENDPNGDLTLGVLGNLGIIGSGALDGLSWVFNAKLGEGLLQIGKDAAANGIREVGTNSLKAIFNKENLLRGIKEPSRLFGNVLATAAESGGKIGLITSKILNGEKVTAKEWGELAVTMAVYFGLNIIRDSSIEHIRGYGSTGGNEVLASKTGGEETTKITEKMEPGTTTTTEDLGNGLKRTVITEVVDNGDGTYTQTTRTITEVKTFKETPIEYSGEDASNIEVTPGKAMEHADNYRTRVSNSDGQSRVSSNIITKKGGFEEGTYVSKEEFVSGMKDYLSQNGDDTEVVFRETGRVVSEQQIAEMLGDVEGKTFIDVSGQSPHITNQDTAAFRVKGDTFTGYRRAFMFGNEGFHLPDGHYVPMEELQSVLSRFSIKTPQIEEISSVIEKTFELVEDGDSKKKYLWLLSLLLLLLGFGKDGKEIKTITTEDIETLTYLFKLIKYEDIYETDEEVVSRLLSEVEIGKEVEANEGVTYYHESDRATKISAEFGGKFRDPGKYNVEAISLVDKDGNILEVAREDGVNLVEFVKEVAKKYGVNESDLTLMIHLNGPVSGWVDAKDLIEHMSMDDNRQVSKTVEVESGTYTGTIGKDTKYLEITNDDGSTVRIDLCDKDGNYYKKGDVVTGSDGNQYVIDDIADDIEHKENETITIEEHWNYRLSRIPERIGNFAKKVVGLEDE